VLEFRVQTFSRHVARAELGGSRITARTFLGGTAMIREVPPPTPGSGGDVPKRHVLHPGKGPRLDCIILSRRPWCPIVHFVLLLHRTLPCLQVRCPWCRQPSGIVTRAACYLAVLAKRPAAEYVLALPYDRVSPITTHPTFGGNWRGQAISVGRDQGRWGSVEVEAHGLVPAERDLPPEWDVQIDLNRVWAEYIPRAWDGRLTPPPPVDPPPDRAA